MVGSRIAHKISKNGGSRGCSGNVAGALMYSGNQILLWDFPDRPVVKTLCFHRWGNEFNPWLGN